MKSDVPRSRLSPAGAYVLYYEPPKVLKDDKALSDYVKADGQTLNMVKMAATAKKPSGEAAASAGTAAAASQRASTSSYGNLRKYIENQRKYIDNLRKSIENLRNPGKTKEISRKANRTTSPTSGSITSTQILLTVLP